MFLFAKLSFEADLPSLSMTSYILVPAAVDRSSMASVTRVLHTDFVKTRLTLIVHWLLLYNFI